MRRVYAWLSAIARSGIELQNGCLADAAERCNCGLHVKLRRRVDRHVHQTHYEVAAGVAADVPE